MAFVIPNKKPAQPVTANTATTSQTTQQIEAIIEQPTSQAVEQAVAIKQEQPVVSQAVANPLDLAIEQQLSTLISKIEASIPDVRHEMITIHKALAKDPAQVTILSTEQRAAIFAGYSKLAGIELVAKASAKKAKKDPISIDMFE